MISNNPYAVVLKIIDHLWKYVAQITEVRYSHNFPKIFHYANVEELAQVSLEPVDTDEDDDDDTPERIRGLDCTTACDVHDNGDDSSYYLSELVHHSMKKLDPLHTMVCK